MRILDLLNLLSQYFSFDEQAFAFLAREEVLSQSIEGVTCDSRKVARGMVFCAIPGEQANGTKFIDSARDKGASVIIAEKGQEGLVPASLRQEILWVDNVRLAYALICQNFYCEPKAVDALHSVAVTGTNGKTTIAYLLSHMLNFCAHRTALQGTIAYGFPDDLRESQLTTRGSEDFFPWLNEMMEEGAEALVLEASSHALDQYRLGNMQFSVGIFTNLSHEHLDYHHSMDEYFLAKARLFSEQVAWGGTAIINADDTYADRLSQICTERGLRIIRVGVTKACDYQVRKRAGVWQVLEKSTNEVFKVYLQGKFNAYNMAQVIAASRSLLCATAEIHQGLEIFSSIPGRMQEFGVDDKKVFVDYAHTPDALENVLRELRAICSKRLHLVFGCGGDRDRAKRPVFAQVAEQYADTICLTEDNSRSEDPEQIFAEITAGFTGAKHTCVADRKEAIHTSYADLQPGDILLVAGKGHEKYQFKAGKKYEFSDCAIVEALIAQDEE